MKLKKRIGILSYYHTSCNYGGLLQAYALTRVVGNCENCEAEQVQVQLQYSEEKAEQKTLPGQVKKLLNPLYVWRFVSYKIQHKIHLYHTKRIQDRLALRKAACASFERSVPHSEREYTYENIAECEDDYDLLIAGSDQVWNYEWFNPVFFLNFSKAPKIAYAVSLGHTELPTEWQTKYKELIKDFSAISVREEEAVDIIRPISPVPVEWVLDPTLLLTREEWDEICPPRQVAGPYMFCYFLGESERDRKVARAVAKKKGLKIVTIPHLWGAYRACDKNFGDDWLWEVSPDQFVSLIKYADFVLTDSFHASVFSTLYSRPFATFEREGLKGMGGRLRSLTDITGTQERFLNTPERTTAEYICALPDELPPETEKTRLMKQKSMDFLRRNIETARRAKETANAQ